MIENCNGCETKQEIVDSYIPFEYYGMKEKPEVVKLCQKCVDEDMAYWRSLGFLPSHKVKAKFEEVLAEEMGFQWKEDSIDGKGVWIYVISKGKKITKGKKDYAIKNI